MHETYHITLQYLNIAGDSPCFSHTKSIHLMGGSNSQKRWAKRLTTDESTRSGGAKISVKTMPGWWFQPIWKIWSSSWKSSPIFGVIIKKNIWNHHLDAPLGFLKLKKKTHHFPDRSEKVGKSPFWARRLTADKPPPNNIGRSDSSLFAWKKFPTKIWTANPFWVVSTTPPKTNSWNLTKSPLSTGKSSSKLVFFGSMLVFFLKTCHESNHQEIHGLHPSLASDHPLREIIAKSHECKRAAPLVLATSPFFRKTHRTKNTPHGWQGVLVNWWHWFVSGFFRMLFKSKSSNKTYSPKWCEEKCEKCEKNPMVQEQYQNLCGAVTSTLPKKNAIGICCFFFFWCL